MSKHGIYPGGGGGRGGGNTGGGGRGGGTSGGGRGGGGSTYDDDDGSTKPVVGPSPGPRFPTSPGGPIPADGPGNGQRKYT